MKKDIIYKAAVISLLSTSPLYAHSYIFYNKTPVDVDVTYCAQFPWEKKERLCFIETKANTTGPAEVDYYGAHYASTPPAPGYKGVKIPAGKKVLLSFEGYLGSADGYCALPTSFKLDGLGIDENPTLYLTSGTGAISDKPMCGGTFTIVQNADTEFNTLLVGEWPK